MKKVLLPLVACSFVLFSCKKDYTCECTETQSATSASLNEVDISNSSITVTGVTKKFVQDELECYTTESTEIVPDEFVGYDEFFDPIYETVTYTNRNECTISK